MICEKHPLDITTNCPYCKMEELQKNLNRCRNVFKKIATNPPHVTKTITRIMAREILKDVFNEIT